MFGINDPNDSQVVTIPDELPVLPLRNMVALPFTTLPIAVGVPRSVRLVQEAMQSNRLLALVTSRDPDIDEPTSEQVHDVGSVAVIQRIVRGENNTLQLVVNVLERIKVQEWTSGDPYLRARVTVARDVEDDETPEAIALRRTLLQVSREVVELMPNLPDEVGDFLEQVEENRLLVYMIGANARMELEQRQQLLELDDVNAKMRLLIDVLTQEREVLAIGQRISQETQQKVGKEQREFILRRQMDAIRKELGEVDDEAAEAEAYREKIEKAGLPKEAFEQANRELKRLERLSAQSAEYGVIKTYLDWMVELPWNTFSEDNLDIDNARRVLDEDHYDLRTVKDRILEFLAVRKLAAERAAPVAPAARSESGAEGGDGENADSAAAERKIEAEAENEARGAILLFVGPPGVGKTSLAKSIARALGREFTRMSLGGMRDEAEIRGHRRTYVGALPGRILQGLRQAGTRNPVFMLDEIDKLGNDFRGDPASALLEVLDPEQNAKFSDHYLNTPFDLSRVMWITTANLIDPIPGPLRDRMEVIRLAGYTPEEKAGIAGSFLIPRQMVEHGLPPDRIQWASSAIGRLVSGYTAEAGVRNLERQVAAICRKIARRAAEGDERRVRVSARLLPSLLGAPRYLAEELQGAGEIGVANGLAWTEHGGEMLRVEVETTPGQGLVLTGQLGDVMKESGQAALTWARAYLARAGIDDAALARRQVHVHVPAGGIPKDGPSAGITLATALVSLAIGRPVRADVAMTGEVTLRGRVLPVGGVREKALAALRAGVSRVIVPERNLPDLDEIPREARRQLEFIAASHMEEVLTAALEGEAPTPRRAPLPRRSPLPAAVPAAASGVDAKE